MAQPGPIGPIRSSCRPVVAVLVAGIGFALVACSANPTPEPLPTSWTMALPTIERVTDSCGGVGLIDATLAGDPSDPRLAWLQTPGGRLEIVWPPGYTARFDRFVSNLEVLDPTGRVVYGLGDPIDGGCTAGPPNDPGSVLLILPPP